MSVGEDKDHGGVGLGNLFIMESKPAWGAGNLKIGIYLMYGLHQSWGCSGSSPREVGGLWTSSMVQLSLSLMDVGKHQIEESAVERKNSCVEAPVAETWEMVRGIIFPLVLQRARQKRTMVSFMAELQEARIFDRHSS